MDLESGAHERILFFDSLWKANLKFVTVASVVYLKFWKGYRP